MKLLTLLLFLLPAFVYAGEALEIELTSGNTISIDAYAADDEILFLYLPSERGLGKGYVATAQQLSFFEKSVWAVDLHSSYMAPKHRSSINRFNIDDLVELIDISQTKGFKTLFFVASGRGAQLALKAAHQWQLTNPDADYLKGHILHSPHLISGSPALGSKANYVDIAKASNLPIYVLLPQYGTKYFRADEIAQNLKIGGSSVFIHRLRDVHGGFHMRDDKDLTKQDIKAKSSLSDIYLMAVDLMSTVQIPSVLKVKNSIKAKRTISFNAPELKPYTSKQNIALALNTYQGKQMNINNFKGKALLVNFWASWCKPCVKEIPSLIRLQQKLKDRGFVVITVNIGESHKQIKAFMQKVKFDFPIMMDTQGKAIKDWGVYAFPSNFLLDKNGVIRYAYLGALEWDAKPIVETIKSIL
ncbi:Thioredoxin family protein [Bathymodiolus heckerae thiotrophic gill symbiont]|uniref:TlpA disulfide reductase family protein n=1 Tax=Bathymodiolus heckerae thiotrophic gill symbiont TaxID=1052212 RepID=UPI0010B5C812|nr:TlpA disulfide reductase family protein [Bathymodiolus heckerae thiotrophic gill symbiont]SMN12927.1 Thioredoxin family protein [Bathymodiolus heckerae thiotrophic gill symbiont]